MISDLVGSSASFRQLTLLLSHALSLTALALVLDINRSAVVRGTGIDATRLESYNVNLPLLFIVGVVFYIESRRFLIRDSPRPATTYEQKTGGADGVKGA